MKLITTVSEIPNFQSKIGKGTVEKIYDNSGNKFGMGVVYNSEEGSRSLLTLCSKNYMLIQNTDILSQIHGTFDSNDKLIIKENNGSMTLTIISQEELKDGFSPSIIARNSMNGRDKFTLQPGLLKLVCQNGMISGDRLARKSIMHLKSRQRLIPEIYDEYRDQLLSFLDVYEKPELFKVYNPLKLEILLKKLGKKRLEKFVIDFKPESVRDVYDSITDFASNKNHYNYELIAAASSILYNPALLV